MVSGGLFLGLRIKKPGAKMDIIIPGERRGGGVGGMRDIYQI